MLQGYAYLLALLGYHYLFENLDHSAYILSALAAAQSAQKEPMALQPNGVPVPIDERGMAR